jgi:hypothetical protein
VSKAVLRIDLGKVVHVGLDLGLHDIGRTGRILVHTLVPPFPEIAAGLLSSGRWTEEQEQEVFDIRHGIRRLV